MRGDVYQAVETGRAARPVWSWRAEMVSTPVQNLTVPPGENLTDRRGDEPQFVVPS
jgi:hypothetical protein